MPKKDPAVKQKKKGTRTQVCARRSHQAKFPPNFHVADKCRNVLGFAMFTNISELLSPAYAYYAVLSSRHTVKC